MILLRRINMTDEIEKVEIPLENKYDWIHFNAEEIRCILHGLRLRKKTLEKELLSTNKKNWTKDSKRKIEVMESVENKIANALVTYPRRQ